MALTECDIAKEPGVKRAIVRLNASAAEAHATFGMLEERLEEVMDPDINIRGSVGAGHERMVSPVEMRIDEACDSIESLIARMRTVLDRLEV